MADSILGLVPFEDDDDVYCSWYSQGGKRVDEIELDYFTMAIITRSHYNITSKTPFRRITCGYFSNTLYWDGTWLYECIIHLTPGKAFIDYFTKLGGYEFATLPSGRPMALRRKQVSLDDMVGCFKRTKRVRYICDLFAA